MGQKISQILIKKGGQNEGQNEGQKRVTFCIKKRVQKSLKKSIKNQSNIDPPDPPWGGVWGGQKVNVFKKGGSKVVCPFCFFALEKYKKRWGGHQKTWSASTKRPVWILIYSIVAWFFWSSNVSTHKTNWILVGFLTPKTNQKSDHFLTPFFDVFLTHFWTHFLTHFLTPFLIKILTRNYTK